MKKFKIRLGKGFYIVASNDENIKEFLEVIQNFSLLSHKYLPNCANEFDGFIYTVVNSLSVIVDSDSA